MVNAHINKLSETDNRLIGISLILIGLGWVSLQPMATELAGSVGLILSEFVFGSAGIGTIHIIFGIYLVSNEQLNRSFSFTESALVGVVALIASGWVLLYWESLQSGVVRVEWLMSFPFFACYVVTWGFSLGFATTRRQRVCTVGVLCVIPIAILVAIPILILIGGGWMIIIAMASVPVILALIPLMLLFATPLLLAGRSVRSHHLVTTR